MASKQTYPCFACRKAGYEIPVYLDGKDEQGRTKYLNEDGTRHTHYVTNRSVFRATYAQTEQSQEQQTTISDLLVSMNAKLDRLLNLAERK